VTREIAPCFVEFRMEGWRKLVAQVGCRCEPGDPAVGHCRVRAAKPGAIAERKDAGGAGPAIGIAAGHEVTTPRVEIVEDP
jgi:hypothetical protein